MIDTIIVISYLFITLCVGLYISRKVKDHMDYAMGGKQYSSFVVFATLSASFIGGGFTIGLAEKIYLYGFVFVFAIWGFSVKEMLMALCIAPKMKRFSDAITVGDIMEQAYGGKTRLIAGVASVLVCGGIIGAQIAACGNILHTFLGISASSGSIVTASIVVMYATMGGLKAVVAIDVMHFLLLIVMLPLVAVFGLQKVGGIDHLFATLPPTHLEPLGSIGWGPFLVLFFSFFFGETLIPPYVQRLLIGKTTHDTVKGTLCSGLMSFVFFTLIGVIGATALVLDPTLPPAISLPYAIKTIMPIGLKGLAIAAMLAVVMSSADSFLNATSVAMRYDVLAPLGIRYTDNSFREVMISRLITLIIGFVAITFALRSSSVIDILLYSYQFWTPFILIPFVAAIYGLKAPSYVFVGSAIAGNVMVLLWDKLGLYHIPIEGALENVLAGITVNALVFYLLYRWHSFQQPSTVMTS